MAISDIAFVASTLIASDVAARLDIKSFCNVGIHIDKGYRKISRLLFDRALDGEENLTAAHLPNLHNRGFEITTLGGMAVAKGVMQVRPYRKYRSRGEQAEETRLGADYGVNVVLAPSRSRGGNIRDHL